MIKLRIWGGEGYDYVKNISDGCDNVENMGRGYDNMGNIGG